MGKRGPSAQYAYGITIEAGNYNEVINGFEKRLKDLDKVTKTTTATFAALSEAMKSGKQVDFSKAEGQLTGLVAEMEEVAKWREQLAGGQKLSDMFDGLEQVKQSLGQVTGQLDKFGDNIEEIFSILQNVPQNTSKTFVDIRKVLSQTASDMNKIIAELNNPTEKTDVSGLKNQLSSLATDFVNEWNKAAAQGIKMDQVVDFKPFANIIKTAISGARSLGAEFNDVSASVTEATKNVVALYSVKHPTGMFKDLTSGLSSVESQAKRTEQAASKAVSSFKATIGIVDKLNKSDMGLSKNSKEMEEFLAKLQNPEITVKINKKDPDNVIDTFYALQDKVDELAGGSVLNLTQDFFKDIPVEKLKELGDALQNIIAIGNHKDYKKILNFGDDVFGTGHFSGQIKGYSSDLEQVMTELESRLNEAKQSVQDLSNTLQQMVEKAGLKEIKVELGIKDDIDDYVNKINATITNIEKQSNRIKKIPVMLAFDNNDSDENKTAIETLKQNLGDLKKSIHDARTEINQDTKVIKQSIVDALNVNAKDMVNVRAALEDAFNIEPLEILINDEFLVNQIQNALKNKTYDISLNANINGANYSGGGVQISRVSGGGISVTQQSTATDKQEHASEGQSKAAEEQKSAAQTNDKSAQLLSKASQEMTAFVKKFANTYYRAKTQQKELDDKVASGGELNETERRRLSRANGSIRNLTPIKEYLQSLFGDKVDLSKITEEAMSKVLTSLMQSNGKGSFKGELLSEDLLGLLTGLKGKYRSKYGNGIGDLLNQLVGTGGKNGTLDAMFKSFGLNSATFAQTNARDYTAPDVLKYYQSFARLADLIDSIKIHPENVSNESLKELSNILKGIQNMTTSEEYKANIAEIGKSINILDESIKDYNTKLAATADLDTKEGEDYTPLLNMFKELYSKVDEVTKSAISSAIGANPSDDIIKGDQLTKAREAVSKISGNEAASKIASDLLRWLDRMISGDNVVLSREKLLDLLGKGEKGAGLKIGTIKNLLRKDSKNGSSKNSQVQGSAVSLASSVLKELDADIYFDDSGNPIVINRKDSPTQKRKTLRMIQNRQSAGRQFAIGTQIYNKDNPRPRIEDERRPESSIQGTTDWGKRLASIDAELAKTSSEYEATIKKRDEVIKQIEQKEQEISKQIDIARKNVEEAKGNLSEVNKGANVQNSGDINNIKSAIRDREKLYNLMAEMDKSYIPDFELSKRNVSVSDTYKQLIEERKKVSSRIKAAKGTSDFYKKIENGTSEDKSGYVKAAETKVSEIEAYLLQLNTQLTEAEKVNDNSKIKHYKKLIVDKTNELESARDKLSNYQKIASGQTVSTEYDSRVVEQENILANLNAQINDELDSQRQQMDKDTYSLLLKIIEQYKERQSKLKGLEKDLSKYKEGSKEHDNILVQIDSLKTNLNSMVDEISQISSTLGLDNKDLENAFAGMSSGDFFSSKETRTRLAQEVKALSTFKKDSLANVSIFPTELQKAVQRRNELLTNKSELQHINQQLKDLKIRLYKATENENEDEIAFYEERIKILTERKKDLGFIKNIDPELKKLDNTILSYIRSRIDELAIISKTDFNVGSLSKYEVDNSVSSKYQREASSKSTALSRLEQEAKLLAKNKENANSDVASLENKRKVLEKQRELAQLQVDYNTKRMEELQLTGEIASLEKSDPSSEVLAQKRQQLKAVNAELSEMYNQIHAAGSTTNSETLDESLSADQKKLIALEKIIEAQKIIAQNEEMQNRARAKIKDSSSISNIKHDSETGKFTTQYGNESKLTRYTSDRFRSIYTQSDEFIQFRSGLYEEARKKISSFESSLSQKITKIIDNMSKDAISKIVESKYGTKGVKANEASWNISIETLDRELREAIEKRANSIREEYNKDVDSILADKSLNAVVKNNRITTATTERDSKISSLYSGGTEFKSIFARKAKKFKEYYYQTLANLLGESENGLDESFLKAIEAQFKQLTMVKGADSEGKIIPTAFGKRVSSVFNWADTKSNEIIKKKYEEVDKKLEENIVAYMKEISSDETRLEGELANDVVFKDRMGNRINLTAEYRNANQYNLDRVTSLGQENKAQKEWISKLREYGGISDEEMKYIQEAKERALLKVYGGSESEIKNLDILIGDVDTTPIEEATTSIANQTIKAAAETAKKAADDKLSTPTVPETAPVQQAEQAVEGAAQSSKESVSKESKTTTKTSAEYKDAVKIVKEAIGSFRGRTDKSKAEFYGTLGKEVKDAANLIYRTPAENRTKEGNALLNKMMGLKNATQEKQKQTTEEIKQTTEKQKQTTEEVKQTAEQQKQVELSDAEKLKLAKKELQNRIDTAKGIAQDGTKSKSKEVIKSGSIPSVQNPEYVFNEGVESTSEFVKEVWNLTEAFRAGANAANIEYGFATQNGKRIQLAKGDNGSVDFQRFYGDVDSLTHSHSYTKGLNNMVFSLEDINQLEQLGTRNNLKKYNLIYDNEMMSLNLGKNSQEAAEAIADCYPQINDVVMAMLSREDGNSIPAENSDEMARILNGYLQKVVEDAGGRLSVVNSKGENVTSKYSITDDEYSKLNNILAKSQNYYNDNLGTVSKSDYVSVIRQYIAEEFGKEFMANVRAKSDANPHGGVYTEFSAIPEYDDEDKKMLDYAEQVTLYSKKIVAAEKAFVESLQKMSNEDLMAFIKQGEETLGIKKEPEVKPTLTKAQISALNPDDVTALQKASIKQFSKARNWNENNVGNIEGFLGADNKTLVAYKTQFEELAKIALDLKAKGESGTIITKDDISQLDVAISKTKELQNVLTKEAQFKQMKDAGLIVSGKTKIKPTDSYSERQDIMAQYAKKYATQNKSEYQFGQYDFINDKISFNMIDSAGQVTKVIMGWSDAFNTAYIQSSKLQGSLDKITQEVYKTDEAIKAGEEYGFFQEQSEGVKAYKDALAEYEAQVKAVTKSSQKDLAQNFEELHAAQEKAINAGKDLLDKQKDAYGFNNAQKVLGRTGNVDATLQNYRDQGINVNDIELVKNYNDAITALNDKVKTLKENGKLWDSDEQPGLKLLADRAIEAEKALLKADEAQRQLSGEVIKGKDAKFFEGINPNNVDQVKQAMEQYARSINGVDAQSIKWSEDQKTLSYSVRTGKREVSDFTIGVKELTNEFYETRTGTRAVKTGMEEFLSSVGSKFKEVGRYLLSFSSFYRVWGEIQKGVTYIREIDSALTELKKVTDETDETYAQFLKTMSQTGAEVGATVKDLTNMAANWARLGYSIQEAGELAKSTAVLLNVSEFTDADTASEALISTMQAYGYAAEDSMHVVDVLNEIGNNFAISSDGIATALQDSASSLMAAGNNLEQSVAMIAAANKVLQDPNSVGAALRTISLRIRGTSVKVLEEMGEETDGVIESVSKLQAKVKGLSGVDILTDTGAYKDTYTIIKEIGQVWADMNDINRAALLELLAGKNRSNAMAALLTNMEDLEGAYESAMEAQGSAEAENEKYMNSIQGRIDQFTNALQTMWKNAIDSDFVKFIVSIGTALVKVVNWLGMIPTILGTIAGAMSTIKGQNLFVNLTGNGNSGIITELIQKVKKGVPAIKEFNSLQSVEEQAKFLNNLKETNPELASYIIKTTESADVTKKNGVVVNNAKVSQGGYRKALILTTAETIGLKIATAALNAAITMAVSALISFAISGITKLINKQKDLRQSAEETINTYNDAKNKLRDNKATIDGLSSDYERLSKGVDDFGNNISLTTDEYKKYNEITNKIADMFPEMISGYTKEGNAILSCKGNVDELTKAYEAAAHAARQAAIAGGSGVFDSAKEEYNSNPSVSWEETGLKQKQKLANKLVELANQGTEEEIQKFFNDLNVGNIEIDGEKYSNIELDALFKEAGIDISDFRSWWDNSIDVDKYKEKMRSLESFIKTSVTKINTETSKVRSILSAYLGEDEDYAKLDDETKSIINNIVSQLDSEFVFSFDNIDSLYNWVSENIVQAFSGNNEKVQNAIKDFSKIDTSSLSVTDYKKEIENFKKVLSDSGISEEAQKQILSAFKIDDDSINAEIDPLVNHTKSILKDEFDDKVDSLTISDLKIVDSLDIPDGTLLTWDELLERINAVKSEMRTPVVQTYDTIKGSIENFNDVQKQTEDIMLDNTEVTQEYKDSLIALGISETDLESCFDKNNKLVVKNVSRLKQLVNASKTNISTQTILARAQARLKYKELYKQLATLTNGQLNSAQANREKINTLYQEMSAIQKVISRYSLLEQQLSEVTKTYSEFEEAQSFDSDNDYMSKTEDMLTAAIKAYETGDLGTETAQVAIKALVPDVEFEGLDTVDEKAEKAHEYLTETLNKYFTLEFDDNGAIQSAEMKLGNLRKFIEDAFSNNVFAGEDWQHFEWSDEFLAGLENAPDKLQYFADEMNVTKEVALAAIQEIKNKDAEWLNGDYGSLFDQIVPETLDAKLQDTTTKLAELNVQLANGKISQEEYETATKQLNAQLVEQQKAASDACQSFIDVNGKIDESQKKLEAYQKQLSTGTDTNGNKLTSEQIEEINGKYNQELQNYEGYLKQKKELENKYGPMTEYTVSVALEQNGINVDEINTELTNVKQNIQEAFNSDNFKGVNKALEDTYGVIAKINENGDIEYSVTDNTSDDQKKTLEELGALNDDGTVNIDCLYAGLTDEQKAEVDKLETLQEKKNLIDYYLSMDGVDTVQSSIDELATTLAKIYELLQTSPMFKANVDQDTKTTLNGLLDKVNSWVGEHWASFKAKVFSIFGGNSGDQESNGTANVSGTAHATGSWGLEQSEHNALVGELGMETVVDPNTGRYYTVGDHGSELVDLPKNAIVFNHKQTEELFKNGHINSRGKAYAEGNAHVTIYPKHSISSQWEGTGYSSWDDNTYDASDALQYASDSIDSAADDVSDAADKFEEVFDWFEVLLEEIEDNISLMNAKLENAVGISAKKGIYSEILNTEQFKLQELYEGIKLYSDYANKLLAKVPDQYKAMAQNGAVAITDFLGEANEEVVDSINNYREWAKKVSDLNQQLEETKKNISDTHVEIQNMVKDEYDNRISLITAVNDRIQGTIDLLDEEGKRSSAVMYEEMIKNSTKQLSELQNKRAEMQQALDKAVSSGDVEKGKSQWYEMVNAINDVDGEINDCRIDLEGFQNSINQLHWDNFEKFIDAIDNVGNEISNLGDLIDEEDVVDEVGNWTKKGITALGLYAQEMERAKYRAEQYGKEIEYLNQEYAAGKYSVDEYNEKLQELKDGQWDSIKSYESAKKSIIDLNKTRVEAIKDGIQKEIDAYSELIDKKKEELNLQKDAHDFQKEVAEKQKSIAEIQKKLSVMAGDNSASAIAQKKQLQAQLSAAQEELDELYYNHSIEKQGEALDKQLENYQDSKDKEMEQLDESLKNEEQVISDSYATIAANTESVAQTLAEIASQYGITLSDSVTKPWLDGANAIGTYQEQLDTSMSSFTQQLEALKKMYADLQAQADGTGKSMIDAINSNKSKTESSTYTPPQSTQPSTPSQPSKPSAPSAGASVTVKKSATNFSRDGGNGTRMQSWVPGSTFTVYQVSGSEVLIGRNGGYTGWVRLSDIEGYAKGTKGVTNDQLAMLDELGEELVLHAGKDGKLQFLTKGTSVIPSDITENLMKLGSLDPRQVLDNNRPSIGAPHIINNNMEINMEIAEVVHIDHADNSSIPDITKAVQKQMDAYMKNINQGLKRYTR
jgi:TP901 family phage tail tape measure protein